MIRHIGENCLKDWSQSTYQRARCSKYDHAMLLLTVTANEGKTAGNHITILLTNHTNIISELLQSIQCTLLVLLLISVIWFYANIWYMT